MNAELILRVMLLMSPARGESGLRPLADAIAHATNNQADAAFLTALSFSRTQFAAVNPFGYDARHLQSIQDFYPVRIGVRQHAMWAEQDLEAARSSCGPRRAPEVYMAFFRNFTCTPNRADQHTASQVQWVDRYIAWFAARMED